MSHELGTSLEHTEKNLNDAVELGFLMEGILYPGICGMNHILAVSPHLDIFQIFLSSSLFIVF